jgi:hypothetical protein
MIDLVLIFFAILCVGAMFLFSQNKTGMIQYPFLCAAVMAGWVLPQLVGLSINESVDEASLIQLTIFTIFCFIAGWIGYFSNRKPAEIFDWQFSNNKILMASAVLSVLGSFFHYRVGVLESQIVGLWTGPITIYVFLASMLYIGTVMAVVVHIRNPTISSGIIIVFGISFLLYRVFFLGRRENAVELFILLLVFLWFRYRWIPARIFVFSTVFIGVLFVNSIGEYRSALFNRTGYGDSGAVISRVIKINFFDQFIENISSINHTCEIRNASMHIQAAQLGGYYDYGASTWNYFVHYFVPAQLLGSEFKESLKIDVQDAALTELSYTAMSGSTSTGMASSFRSFGYFGVVNFFLIGFIMSRWFHAAQRNMAVAQMVVMLMTAKSLLAITHHTHAFFLEFVSLAIFLLPALYFARKRPSTSKATSYGAMPRGKPVGAYEVR